MHNIILTLFAVLFVGVAFGQNTEITVLSALWGDKNVVQVVGDLCNKKNICDDDITTVLPGKPKTKKSKSLMVTWKCSGDDTIYTQTIPHEVSQKNLHLVCKIEKTTPTLPLSPPIDKAVSLSGDGCPGTTKTLYRCVRDGYFDANKVIRNMLGDERAEHTSWKVTSLLKNYFRSQENLDDYHWAKQEVALLISKIKAEAGACSISSQASFVTAGGGTLENSNKALGILASNGSGYAEDYCTWSKDKKSVALVIEDRNQMNGLVEGGSYAPLRGAEYVLPISIPHDSITAGFTNDLAIYKLSEGESFKLEIRERIQKGFSARKMVASFLENSREVQPLKMIIKPCTQDDECLNLDDDFTKAEKIIPELRNNLNRITDLYQTRFKLIVP